MPPLVDPELVSIQLRAANLHLNGTEGSSTRNAQLHAQRGLKPYLIEQTDSPLSKLADLEEEKIDMCGYGCMAYVGEHQDKDKCDQVREVVEVDEKGDPILTAANRKRRTKLVCNQPRYRPPRPSARKGQKVVPFAQFNYLPIVLRICQLFRDPATAQLLRYFGKEVLQAKLARERNGGFPDSFHNIPHGNNVYELFDKKPHLFDDERNGFFGISRDGAIVSMDKKGDFWVIILTIFNFPPDRGRYHDQNQIVLAIIPAEKSPIDLESFFVPLYSKNSCEWNKATECGTGPTENGSNGEDAG